MSNEEIVVLIQAGHTELFADLWTQIERLVSWKAKRAITAIGNRGGVEFEDLHQSGYIAMVAAVNTYDPEGGKFSSWFMLHLRTAFAEATGIRTEKQANDPIHKAVSLEYPLCDDADSAALLEVIPDPAGEIQLQSVEDQIYREQLNCALNSALDKLPEQHRDVIRRKYLEDFTTEQIADESKTTVQAIQQCEKNGMRQLRHPSIAKLLRPFYDFDYYGHSGFGAFKNSGMSVQERYLIYQERFMKT